MSQRVVSRHRGRRKLIGSLAILLSTLVGPLLVSTQVSAGTIYYKDVYLTVNCNPNYYGSTTYAGSNSTALYVTYYGGNHWQVRLDSGYGTGQWVSFSGYCNGMYGQAQYKKGTKTGWVSIYGTSYYWTI